MDCVSLAQPKAKDGDPMKRVICGLNENGVNVVLFEDPLRPLGFEDEGLAASSAEAGEAHYLAWAAPDLITRSHDYSASIPDFSLKLKPGETRFVRVEIAPGSESGMHRTPNINDYLIAMQGELTMFLEDGSSTKITAGDMFVQLTGWHSWKNTGTETFVMAGVVIGVETDEDFPFGVQMAQA